MDNADFLTENEVIQGVANYLAQKGRTSNKRLIRKSDAAAKQHGIDLLFKLENDKGNGNWYCIEAKGNVKASGEPMRSTWNTNFRWAVSQIILRIKVDSTRNNYIYGIAMPRSDIEKCIKLIQDNWALKKLRIRLYGAYRMEDHLTAVEYIPSKIYR